MHLIITHDLNRVQRDHVATLHKIPPSSLILPLFMASKEEIFCNSWKLAKSLTDLVPIITKTTALLPEKMMDMDEEIRETLSDFPEVFIVYLPSSTYLPIEKPIRSPAPIMERLQGMDWEKYAQHLLDDGYAVIPVMDPDELKATREQVQSEMKKFPEYLDPSDPDTIFIYSGFGALGNPAAFHNPAVRSLRLRMMLPAARLVSELNRLEGKDRMIEQLIDRLSLRRKGTSTTAESFHKDQAPLPFPEDDIFGGWINLDLKEDQYFSAVPKTHTETRGKSGFARLTKEQVEHAEKNKIRIVIPPGHWMCFFQNITHEVVQGKMKYSALRLYTGFRLTTSEDPLFSVKNKKVMARSGDFTAGYDLDSFDYDEIISEQGVPPGPSGQRASMYAKMNLIYPKQRETLDRWSQETFKPECLEEVTVKGEKYTIIKRFMDSLEEYGFEKYRDYSPYEMDILRPAREWTIPLYGGMVHVSLGS